MQIDGFYHIMNISQEKDKIRDIIRRSSMRNYFSPLLPKHHKVKRTHIPKRLEKLNINLKKNTLKILISPKNQNLIKETQQIMHKPKYFIRLSSSTLNSSEIKLENPIPTSIQQSLVTKADSELLNKVPNETKFNNPIIRSIIYENHAQQFQYRHVANITKKIERKSQINYNDSIKSNKYPSPKSQLSQTFLEPSLDAWEADCFPDFF